MKLNIAGVAFDGECNSTIQGWSAFKGYKKRKVRRIKDHIFSLWREALVCRTDPRFPTNRCGLGFFVDSDIHGYGLFLAK
ncbi:MAG: hypothetical protein OHK0019_37800 [Saprospiraceae bacterium]